MTPQQPDQHDQRIWPSETPDGKRPLPVSIARRLASPIRRLLHAATSLTTPPGIISTPDGVTYQPLARTTLERALADQGHLDFAVTFPKQETNPAARTRMRIRATTERVFHDLIPSQAQAFQALVHASIATTRPGDRVLLLGAGTGALTAYLADHVGPSGGVTAFETDAQSVAFARSRYPLPNAAHERLNNSTLSAEPTGAAETIILTARAPARGALANPAELLARLTGPGRLLLVGPHAALAEACRALPGVTVEPLELNRDPGGTDSAFVLVRKQPTA